MIWNSALRTQSDYLALAELTQLAVDLDVTE